MRVIPEWNSVHSIRYLRVINANSILFLRNQRQELVKQIMNGKMWFFMGLYGRMLFVISEVIRKEWLQIIFGKYLFDTNLDKLN